MRSSRRSPSRLSWFTYLAGTLLLASCRIETDEIRWIEAHGAFVAQAIAASPRGLDAIGEDGRIHHYPGPWGQPWVERARAASAVLAASPQATYLVDTEGVVWRARANSGEPVRWTFSTPWRITDLSVGESDSLYVVSNGRAGRVARRQLQPLACSQEARDVSAASRGVYVVSENGKLWLATGSRCEEVPAPGPLTSIAAYDSKLAAVSRGVAYSKRGDEWKPLPDPVIYRPTGRWRTKIKEVSLSRNTLWAMGDEGHVFMLSHPP